MTIERGYDPRDFTLLANGGAGPSHAWVLCGELGLTGFVVPAAATAESAYGTGNSDIGLSAERAAYLRTTPRTMPGPEQLGTINEALADVTGDVRRNLAQVATNAEIAVERSVAIRYRGQAHHLDIPLDAESVDRGAFDRLTKRFERTYEELFGRGAAFSNAGYELLSVRAVGSAALPPPALANKGDPLKLTATRQVVFYDALKAVETAIYSTSFPEANASVDGPAIIEFPGQSVVVPPHARATTDRFGNIHVRLAS